MDNLVRVKRDSTSSSVLLGKIESREIDKDDCVETRHSACWSYHLGHLLYLIECMLSPPSSLEHTDTRPIHILLARRTSCDGKGFGVNYSLRPLIVPTWQSHKLLPIFLLVFAGGGAPPKNMDAPP